MGPGGADLEVLAFRNCCTIWDVCERCGVPRPRRGVDTRDPGVEFAENADNVAAEARTPAACSRRRSFDDPVAEWVEGGCQGVAGGWVGNRTLAAGVVGDKLITVWDGTQYIFTTKKTHITLRQPCERYGCWQVERIQTDVGLNWIDGARKLVQQPGIPPRGGGLLRTGAKWCSRPWSHQHRPVSCCNGIIMVFLSRKKDDLQGKDQKKYRGSFRTCMAHQLDSPCQLLYD